MISGPAGATWGTNAVNGVINVVTLPAARTSGVAVNATLGTLEKNVVGRYGAALSDELAVRAHVRTFERGPSRTRGGGDAGDASRGSAGGIRLDWNRGRDAATLIAGVYTGETDERPAVGRVELSGASMTARWSRRLGEASNFDIQAYLDSTGRKDRFLLQEDAQIFDLEAKLRQTVGAHRWLAGGGYRRARDRSEPGLIFAFLPAEQRQRWYNVFAQDEVALGADLSLTFGMRFEHNPYSGWESLPSVHLAYKLGPESLLWGALSRAVRSPARFDR